MELPGEGLYCRPLGSAPRAGEGRCRAHLIACPERAAPGPGLGAEARHDAQRAARLRGGPPDERAGAERVHHEHLRAAGRAAYPARVQHGAVDRTEHRAPPHQRRAERQRHAPVRAPHQHAPRAPARRVHGEDAPVRAGSHPARLAQEPKVSPGTVAERADVRAIGGELLRSEGWGRNGERTRRACSSVIGSQGLAPGPAC
jgi:hypothetical protein